MNNLYKLFRTRDYLPHCYLLCTAILCTLLLFINSAKPQGEKTPSAKSVFNPLLGEFATEKTIPVSSRGTCVIDAKSKSVIFASDKDKILPMASTTKIMTALTALSLLSPDETVTVDKRAAAVEGSSIYLRAGEKITVSELLYGLMLESGNDAAEALAYAACGSIEEFAKHMNETAKSIGLKSTSFTNPHGLSEKNHYTTAYELALLTAHALENETFLSIVSSKSHTSKSDSNIRSFYNHNRLLSSYKGAIGVKTGFTKDAGRCLVSAAKRENETYICVTLGAANDWNLHTRLLDFAFESCDSIKIADKGEFTVFHENIKYANTEDIYLSVKNGEKPTFRYECDISKDGALVTLFCDEIKAFEFSLLHVESE